MYVVFSVLSWIILNSKMRTAIREEPVKLAQYLRGEKEEYGSFVISGEMISSDADVIQPKIVFKN
jgi:hypothetical protein